MSREIKLGLLTLVTLGLVFVSLNFIKGTNVFSKSLTIYTKFDNVAGLTASSPVYINGLKVGAVQSITINPEKITEMIVELRLEGDYQLPKSTQIIFRSDGVVAGNALDLKFTKLCNGQNCVENGDYLSNKKIGLLGSMLSEEEIDEVSGKIGTTVKEVVSAVGREDSQAPVDVSVRELESTLANMTKLTDATNRMIRKSSKSVEITMANLSKITDNMANQNTKISTVMANLEKLSKELADLKLSTIGANANNAMKAAENSMADVSTTLANADKTFAELNSTLKKINEGGGTLGELINNKDLYTNLEKTTSNMTLLLQDLRLNPKRYFNLRRKQQKYTKPEDDPAFIDN